MIFDGNLKLATASLDSRRFYIVVILRSRGNRRDQQQLLQPKSRFYNNISKKDNICIKDALFQYRPPISKIGMKL